MIVLFTIIHENWKANIVAEEVSCKVLWVIVTKSELHNQSREAQGKLQQMWTRASEKNDVTPPSHIG